jgi:hypothetical protein
MEQTRSEIQNPKPLFWVQLIQEKAERASGNPKHSGVSDHTALVHPE